MKNMDQVSPQKQHNDEYSLNIGMKCSLGSHHLLVLSHSNKILVSCTGQSYIFGLRFNY